MGISVNFRVDSNIVINEKQCEKTDTIPLIRMCFASKVDSHPYVFVGVSAVRRQASLDIEDSKKNHMLEADLTEQFS